MVVMEPNGYTLAELKTILRTKILPTSGNKAKLINRLTEHKPQILDTLEEERREKEPGINEQGILEERVNANQGATEARRALEGRRFEDERRSAEEQRRNVAEREHVDCSYA